MIVAEAEQCQRRHTDLFSHRLPLLGNWSGAAGASIWLFLAWPHCPCWRLLFLFCWCPTTQTTQVLHPGSPAAPKLSSYHTHSSRASAGPESRIAGSEVPQRRIQRAWTVSRESHTAGSSSPGLMFPARTPRHHTLKKRFLRH